MKSTVPAFGHFNEDGSEYHITDALAPPRHQVNFLWNDTMISGHNQFGSGEGVFNDQAMLLNHPEGRVRMISKGRRYFYIVDRESGEFWSTGLLPAKPVEYTYRNRVGLGYSVYEMAAHGIESESKVFLAPDESAEIWEISVKNISRRNRDLWLVPYVEWALGGYPTFSNPISHFKAGWDEELKAVLSWNICNERPHDRYNAFVVSDIEAEQWCAGPRDFLGPFGTPDRPDSLIAQKLSCREAWCEQLAGAMALPLKPADGETLKATVALGNFNTREEAARMISKIMPSAYRQKAWDSLQSEKETMIGRSKVQTPDAAINRMVNIWSKQQIQLCAEFGRDGARGFRDTLQDAWGILPFNADLARRKIIETLSHQHQSGQAVRGWMPLQPHNYSDGPTWITPTVVAYLKETGDYDFLQAKALYLDGGEGTVLEHMIQSVRHLSDDTGVHGLVLAHDGDWNDSLNWMGHGGKGESVWTSMSLFHSLKLMKDLAERILDDAPLASEMEERAVKIESAIQEHGWDGAWYLAGYSDNGTKVGSSENEEGQCFLNTQTWAALTGIAQGERLEACHRAVDEVLESQHGSLTSTPAFTREDPNVGRVTVILPGMYENCTPYCHGTAFKIVSDLVCGRPDQALQSYRKVMPDNDAHPSAVSGCEPYAFTNQYLGPDNARAGDSVSGWITGTAGWMYRAVLEYMVGIQPDYDGFHVRPCLPDEWPSVSAERVLRGQRYFIEVKRAGDGYDVFVNGLLLDSDFVAYVNEPVAQGSCQ
ncbi:MAG: GH36-type glycosyl hydrolase domain-containing protein [Puniceicoccales bacterium]